MSTRACYTFRDEHEEFHVYKHSDGYPSGAEKWIRDAACVAWQMPRFEADNFGAAFIAANMRHSECRLMRTGSIMDVAPGDIDYRYEIEKRDGGIYVTAFKTNYWTAAGILPHEENLWSGHLDQMTEWVLAQNKE